MILTLSLILNSIPIYALSARTAVIEKSDGTVYIQKSGGAKKFKVFKGMSLSEGDTIITGSNGTATLALDDDKTIKIAPNTVLNIQNLKGKKGTEATTLNQSKGSTVTSVGDKLLGNSSYSQKTPTAIMGIKGTVVGITQNPGNTLFAVADGTVQVGDTRRAQLALVNPGQQFTVVPGALPAPPAPLALQELNRFTLDSFNTFSSHLPPAMAAQVSDYLKSHPETPVSPAPTPLQPEKIDHGLSAPFNGGGASSGTGGGTSSETPTTPPVANDPVDLSLPLRYTDLKISEYISKDYESAEKLAAFLTSQNVTISSTSSSAFYFEPLAGVEVHLNKNYTIAPNTSIMLPNELLSLDENIMLQLNELLGTTTAGNNHWLQLTAPIPTMFSPNAPSIDPIGTISKSSSMYSNSSFVMTPMIYIHSNQPCEITKSPISAPYYTTPSVYTIEPNSGIGLPLSSFNASNISVSINNGNPQSIAFGNPFNPAPADIAAAFNSAGFEATYGLDIMNASSKAKKLGIDLRLEPKNNIPFNMSSYLNSGFKVSIEDVKNTSYNPEIILNIIGALNSGRFRALAPLKADSVTLDTLNLLNWEYQNTAASASVKNKVIYSSNLSH